MFTRKLTTAALIQRKMQTKLSRPFCRSTVLHKTLQGRCTYTCVVCRIKNQLTGHSVYISCNICQVNVVKQNEGICSSAAFSFQLTSLSLSLSLSLSPLYLVGCSAESEHFNVDAEWHSDPRSSVSANSPGNKLWLSCCINSPWKWLHSFAIFCYSAKITPNVVHARQSLKCEN